VVGVNAVNSIKKAFLKVSSDIKEIRDVQASSIDALRTHVDHKISVMSEESRVKELEDKMDKELSGIKENFETSLKEGEKREQELSATLQSTIAEYNDRITAVEGNVGDEVDRSHQRLDSFSDRLSDINSKTKKFEKLLDLMNSKLQEFENISVDVEDVEKSFITRDEMKQSLADVSLLKRSMNKLNKSVDSHKKTLQKMDQQKYIYARETQMRLVMDDVIDLKSRLVLKNDLESMNDRIDNFEKSNDKKNQVQSDTMQVLEDNLADVISLKKTFVTKDQFNGQRKEIKMLVNGLKDVQKIKDKIKKLKFPKGKNAKGKNFFSSVTDFFIDD